MHPQGRPGRVAIGFRDPYAEKGWREQTVTVSQLPDALAKYAGAENVYIGMQRYRGWRSIKNLRELGAVFSDVDFYKCPNLAGTDPAFATEYVLAALEGKGLPYPSLVIATGRGLVLVWLHDPVPRAALPRWNAVQRVMFEALRALGADAGAKDAARVLRLCGTFHGKSGEQVRIIGGDKAIWSFEDLCGEVLPHHRDQLAELRDIRVHRALRRRPIQDARNHPKGLRGNLKGYNLASLNEARLSDLQTLRALRYGSETPMEDYRDRWLLLAGTFISWITFPPFLKREVVALAEEIGYPKQAALSNMQTVFDRADRAARGERVAFAGIEWDPRYTYSNERIIEVLEIEPHEEEHMRTIISGGMRRRRGRDRKRQERRRAGIRERAEYETAALAREREPIIVRLRDEEKMSLRQISRQTGISFSEVSRLSKRIDKGCS